MVVPPKNFNLNNLENLWIEHGKIDLNKKQVVYEAIPTNTKKTTISSKDIRLKLLDDLEFSLTDFGKVNKGMANSSINCFMNVALQSLIACPAFFNMLTAVSESQEHYKELTESKEILRKFVELSRYFEPRL